MFFENRQGDNGPITRLGTVPIYITTFLVAAVLIGVVYVAFTGMPGKFLGGFFPHYAWREFQIWRVITYFPLDDPNFFTLFMLMFLYSFGQNCEEALGRQRYIGFLGVLILVPVITATIMWLFGMQGGVLGPLHLAIGLVIGFATIYPNIEYWNWVPMKYIAFGCLFLAAVGHVANRDAMGFVATLATSAVSFSYIRSMKEGTFEGFSLKPLFRRKPKLRVLPREEEPRESYAPVKDEVAEEMDALLDKIAKSGIDSLSSKERARLEKAREELIKRGSGR